MVLKLTASVRCIVGSIVCFLLLLHNSEHTPNYILTDCDKMFSNKYQICTNRIPAIHMEDNYRKYIKSNHSNLRPDSFDLLFLRSSCKLIFKKRLGKIWETEIKLTIILGRKKIIFMQLFDCLSSHFYSL